MNDFLDEKRREISDRLKKLQPAVDEARRLEAAAAALAGVGGSARASTSSTVKKARRRGPGRPRGSAAKKRATAKTTTKAAAKRKPVAKPRANAKNAPGLANSAQENELVNELLAPALQSTPEELPNWSSVLVGPLYRGTEVKVK